MYIFSNTYWSLRLTAPILTQMHQTRNRTVGILGKGALACAQYPPFRAMYNDAIRISIYKGQYGTNSTKPKFAMSASLLSAPVARTSIFVLPLPQQPVVCTSCLGRYLNRRNDIVSCQIFMKATLRIQASEMQGWHRVWAIG